MSERSLGEVVVKTFTLYIAITVHYAHFHSLRGGLRGKRDVWTIMLFILVPTLPFVETLFLSTRMLRNWYTGKGLHFGTMLGVKEAPRSQPEMDPTARPLLSESATATPERPMRTPTGSLDTRVEAETALAFSGRLFVQIFAGMTSLSTTVLVFRRKAFRKDVHPWEVKNGILALCGVLVSIQTVGLLIWRRGRAYQPAHSSKAIRTWTAIFSLPLILIALHGSGPLSSTYFPLLDGDFLREPVGPILEDFLIVYLYLLAIVTVFTGLCGPVWGFAILELPESNELSDWARTMCKVFLLKPLLGATLILVYAFLCYTVIVALHVLVTCIKSLFKPFGTDVILYLFSGQKSGWWARRLDWAEGAGNWRWKDPISDLLFVI